MSGSWKDRLAARQPLKPRDVEAALRDLLTATADLISRGEALAAQVAELSAPEPEATEEKRPRQVRAKT